MIINHNMNAMNAHRQMGINVGNQGKAMEKLSSGLRINRAGDDAAGLSISEKMRGQIRGLDQAARNSQDGISLIQTAEGATNETHTILQRMRELAVQASNDTNTGEDREQIKKEITQLTSEINRISSQTQFNTQKLLAADDKKVTIQVGANEKETIEITLKKMDSTALTVNDVSVSDTAKAQASITKIDAGIKKVSEFRADLGAVQNRLESSIRSTNNSSENLQAAESRVRDVDMAKEMMNLSKNNILAQAAQSMLGQANQQPQGVLQLLR